MNYISPLPRGFRFIVKGDHNVSLSQPIFIELEDIALLEKWIEQHISLKESGYYIDQGMYNLVLGAHINHKIVVQLHKDMYRIRSGFIGLSTISSMLISSITCLYNKDILVRLIYQIITTPPELMKKSSRENWELVYNKYRETSIWPRFYAEKLFEVDIQYNNSISKELGITVPKNRGHFIKVLCCSDVKLRLQILPKYSIFYP